MKIKNICCIGAGYVGGPTMAVIALKCPELNITVVDSNQDKINQWNGDLNNLPVYEPGLKNIISQVRDKNLFFSSDISHAIKKSQMIFMAVNTPTKTKGKGAGMAADLKYVRSCARTISRESESDKIIVEKSTLPVRTAEEIKKILKSGNKGVHFEVISNPEFLAEGSAIQDLFKSDRVLIGGDDSKTGKRAVKSLVEIYLKWIPKEKIITTNVWSSELSKLASNAFLAQRISSINSLSALCEKTGADINEISLAVGMDHRIGSKFLNPSVGFGGSCFQKDILNLVYLSLHYGLKEVADYWMQVVTINDYQKLRFSKKILSYLKKNFQRKKVAILGWAFKANTKDSRESAAIYITNYLIEAGVNIQIYDPMVAEKQIISDLIFLWRNMGIDDSQIKNLSKRLKITSSIEDSLKDVAAAGIVTEWDEFKKFNWSKIDKKIKIFDGRNIIKNSFYTIGK